MARDDAQKETKKEKLFSTTESGFSARGGQGIGCLFLRQTVSCTLMKQEGLRKI